MAAIAGSVPKASLWKRFATWFSRLWSKTGLDDPKTEEEIKHWQIR